MASSGMDKELRIVLVGKTCVGKSSVGNSLIKQKQWFPSQKSPQSVTKQCKHGMTHLDDGTLMMVIDTPGLFATSTPNSETISEIVKCVALASPGPHIFVLVLALSRFTQEELGTIKYLKDVFGEVFLDYTIVVFTGKDNLDADGDGDTHSIQKYVANSDGFLRDLVNVECNGRYTAICNKVKSSTHESDVQSVINLIRNTVKENNGGYYEADMNTNTATSTQRQMQKRIIRITELKQDVSGEIPENIEEEINLKKHGIGEEQDRVKQHESQRERKLQTRQELQTEQALQTRQELHMLKEQLSKQQVSQKEHELHTQQEINMIKEQGLQTQQELNILKEQLSKQHELQREQGLTMLKEKLMMKQQELQKQQELNMLKEQLMMKQQEIQKHQDLQKQQEVNMLKEQQRKQQELQKQQEMIIC